MSLLGPVRPPFPLDICISNYYGIIVSPGTYNYHPSAELHCAVILANLRTTLPDLTRRIHCFWMGKYDQVSAHHPRLRGSPAGLVGLAKWVQRGFRLARELDRFLGRCPELLGGVEYKVYYQVPAFDDPTLWMRRPWDARPETWFPFPSVEHPEIYLPAYLDAGSRFHEEELMGVLSYYVDMRSKRKGEGKRKAVKKGKGKGEEGEGDEEEGVDGEEKEEVDGEEED